MSGPLVGGLCKGGAEAGGAFHVNVPEELERDVPLLRGGPAQAVMGGGEPQAKAGQARDGRWRQGQGGEEARGGWPRSKRKAVRV